MFYDISLLYRLDLEVQRDQGKNKALEEARHPLVSYTHGKKTRFCDAYLQVLYQVVKYPQAFWVLTVLDVDQRTNFCRLNRKERKKR
jgi:hypothetical protein